MDLATARTILEHPERASTRADFVAAGLVVAENWRLHPEQLRPARDRGVLTTDAPRRVTRETITRDLADTKRMLDDALRLVRKQPKLTRDQDQPARKLMRLPLHASLYRVVNGDDGTSWLEELHGQQTYAKPPAPEGDPDLMEADPPLKMGPTEEEYSFGDVIARHRAVTAQRDKGRAFAEAFNAKSRERWGS